MLVYLPMMISKRLLDKDRSFIKNIEISIDDSIDIDERVKNRERHTIVTNGVIFEMSINKNLVFYKAYRKLLKKYDNVN